MVIRQSHHAFTGGNQRSEGTGAVFSSRSTGAAASDPPLVFVELPHVACGGDGFWLDYELAEVYYLNPDSTNLGGKIVKSPLAAFRNVYINSFYVRPISICHSLDSQT